MTHPQDPANPRIKRVKKNTTDYLIFSGDWVTLCLQPTLEDLAETKLNSKTIVEFDSSFNCDTAGAFIIAKTLSASPPSSESILPDSIRSLIDKKYTYPKPDVRPRLERFIESVGKDSLDFIENVKSTLSFFGEAVFRMYHTIRSQETFRWTSIYALIETVGLKAVGIISLISLLIGAVLCYQGVRQLEKFGAAPYAIDFLAVSILREISVLMTSIVVAGRSGSSFTAQIGTMKLNQEIDAIRMMGLNPFQVLIIPRIIALVIALPLLVLVSMLTASLGGMFVINATIEIPFSEFWSLYQNAVHKTTFWTGMSKAPLFAIIIAVIGCYRGMQVKGSAESVGQMTTRSVVEAIFTVIICDAVMSIFFTAMDW